MRALPPAGGAALPSFMSARQVAEYLHLNEKKVYALVREGRIPATKITGKWVFPRELIDRWLLASSHGGLLTDRLLVAGSDDPLLYHVVLELAAAAGARALVSYSPTGTRLGLELLAAQRADVGCVHWGPEADSAIRHPALLQQYPAHRDWVLVRALRREQGLIVAPAVLKRHGDLAELLHAGLRWAMRQEGAGTRRFLQEALAAHHVGEDALNVTATALSERAAAAHVAMGHRRPRTGRARQRGRVRSRVRRHRLGSLRLRTPPRRVLPSTLPAPARRPARTRSPCTRNRARRL